MSSALFIDLDGQGNGKDSGWLSDAKGIVDITSPLCDMSHDHDSNVGFDEDNDGWSKQSPM